MGTLSKLALAIALPLAAISANAAPDVKKASFLPDVSSLRYKAKNYKSLFNSDRTARIDEINKRLYASHKGPAKLSSVTPDFILPSSDQYDYIDGPNGSVYFYSAEFVTEDKVISEYYTQKDIVEYVFHIYDTSFNKIGDIKGKVQLDVTTNPQNPETRVASMGLTPILTKKFFNSDEKWEVLVYFNMNTPNYTVNSRTVAFQIDGEKDAEGYDVPICTIQGNLSDVLEANSGRWSEDYYLTFANDYTFPSDPDDDSFSTFVNTQGVIIETYKKVGYGSKEPVKFFEMKMRLNDWPGDQESATPFITRCIDGKPYIFTNGYTDGLWIFEEKEDSFIPEQSWNDKTKFFVNIYQPTSLENPNLLQHTEIDVKKTAGDKILATFYFLGNLSYRNDVDFDNCDEPGKANLIVTTKDWEGNEMGDDTSYYLYGPDGKLKATLGEAVDGVMALSDVKGQEPEYMFIYNENGEYLFEFINPFTGNIHHSFRQTLPWQGDTEGLYVNGDRVASGDSYKYCFELATPGRDADGNDLMRLAWVNTDGEIESVEEVNMGKDVRMAKVYIEQQALNPFLFDTSAEREYMIIVKRGLPNSIGTQEEFLIGTASSHENPVGKILLEVTPDNTHGNLMQVSTLDLDNNPVLWVMFYNYDTEKYYQEFYNLPFSKFAGGEGTVENPYKIATAGDLQCMRDNLDAHYEIIADINGEGFVFAPLGSSTKPFTGSLKGNGHSIYNLTVGEGDYNTGIFSYTSDATISDMTFVNPKINISDSKYNGLLVAQAQQTTVTNVHAVGLSVSSKVEDQFGGLIGTASLNTAVTGCSVTNADFDLPETNNVGGIVAETRTGSTIIASTFIGKINAGSSVGGILGVSGPNAGDIADCHVDADITAKNIVGGIVGEMDTRILIDRCYVEGNISASETFGTKIVNKGYAAGGIAGLISTYYENNDQNPEAADDENPVVKGPDVITNCFVNLESIKTPELPDGHEKSVHRIAGFTSINDIQPDWDKISDYTNIDKFLPTAAEIGFKNNYAVASLAKTDDAVEGDHTTTEGKEIAATDLNAEFFAGLGFKYGEVSETPWKETPEHDPSLFHEIGSRFTASALTVEANQAFDAELIIVSRTPFTTESFADSFAGEISDESVVEMNGEINVENNVAIIGFNALKEGNAKFTANVNGNLASINFIVLPEYSGVEEIAAAEDALKIYFNGTTVSAQDATLEVYSLDGMKVASGRDSVSLEALANGVYVVSAKDADGNKATRKFFLQ